MLHRSTHIVNACGPRMYQHTLAECVCRCQPYLGCAWRSGAARRLACTSPHCLQTAVMVSRSAADMTASSMGPNMGQWLTTRSYRSASALMRCCMLLTMGDTGFWCAVGGMAVEHIGHQNHHASSTRTQLLGAGGHIRDVGVRAQRREEDVFGLGKPVPHMLAKDAVGIDAGSSFGTL